MRNYSLALCALILISSTSVFAKKRKFKFYKKTSPEVCTPLDLRNDILGDVRNQDEVSWCYAYTASDLISYHYNLPRISAAATATDYNSQKFFVRLKRLLNLYFYFGDRDLFKMEHQTGFIELSLSQSFKKGVCLSSDLPTDLVKKIYHNDDGSTQEVMVRMKEAQLQMVESIRLIKKGKYTINTLPYHYEFPHIDKEAYFRILSTSSRKTYFKKIVAESCTNRLPVDRAKIIQRLNGRKVFVRLNQILNRNQIVGIDYSSNVLRNLDVTNPHKQMHTSSIVGRKFNPVRNQCEYLIRNTYGKDCSVYDPRVECEEGNVWIPEKDLFRNLLRLTWLE
jgi:hypothetical protein